MSEWIEDPMRGISVAWFQKVAAVILTLFPLLPSRCFLGSKKIPRGFNGKTDLWLFWDTRYGFYVDCKHGYTSRTTSGYYFRQHPRRKQDREIKQARRLQKILEQ